MTKNLLRLFFVIFFFIFLSKEELAQVDVTSTGGTPSASYTTLKLAFDAINAGTHTGSITINISGDVTETVIAALNASGSGSASYTDILIKPTGGAARTITGSLASELIQFNGADNVTIDGLNTGGNSLTISNTSTSSTSGTSTIKYLADATTNTITNCSILGSSTVALATNGGNIFISTGTTTGNDNITISYCKIGPAGTNLPSKGIYANGSTTSSAIANSNITITNCEIFDFFLTGGCAGIYALTGNTDWSISNNKIYQTASRTFTAAGTMYGIYFSNSTYGNNIQITGNTIGYASNSGTGTLTLLGSSYAGAFQGIYLYAMSTAPNACNINNNIVSDVSLTSSTGLFYGIYNASTASSNTININNNQVKNVGLVTTTGQFTGIYAGAATTLNCSTNVVDNITRNGAGITYGIYYGTCTTITLNGNTIKNISSTSTSSTSNFYGIYSGASPVNENLINNNIYNLTSSSTASQTIIGWYNYTASGTKNVQNNNIYSLSAGGGTATIYGIRLAYGTTVEISGNRVNTLSGGSTIYGIYVSTGTTDNIFKNRIYDLTGYGTSALVYGMYITTATNGYLYNNFISDLKAPSATGTIAVNGLYIAGGTTIGAYYNTIYLNATSSSTSTFGTAGIYASTTPTVDLRNNLVVNTSAPGPTGASYTTAYRRSSTTLTSYANTSNNNLFYAGTPGVTRFIYYDGNNYNAIMDSFKTRVSPRDNASISTSTEKIPFVDIANTPYDLHLNDSLPTQLESGGTRVTSPIAITTDFDNETRYGETGYSGTGTAPDIGADEFEGLPLDLIPPTIVYTPLSNTSSTSARTLVVNVTDATGVPTSAPGWPYLYWRKNSGSWNAVAPSGVSGSNYTFNFGSGVTAGDIIDYYVVAQDNCTPANVGSNPSAGAGNFTSDPPAAGTPPTTPNTYTIVSSISGTFTVGATGDYTSITNAINDIAGKDVVGPIVLNLIDATYTETVPITIPQFSGVNSTNTVTLKPASGNTVTISGSSANGIFKLNGADYFIIDGSNTGGTDKNLTINNSSTASPSATIWISSLGTGTGAVNNTVKNCNIGGGSSSTTGIFGIYVGGTSLSLGGADNDNITIQNNSITNVSVGIYAYGTASVSAGGNDNLSILQNTITVNTTTTTANYGIQVGYGLNSNISQNTIDVNSTASGQPVGISVETGFVSSTVTRNLITRVNTTATGGYGGRGITIGTGTATSSLTISNNVIFGVNGSNYSGFGNSSSMGIAVGVFGNTSTLTNATGGVDIYYNSINMYGNHSYSSATNTAALYVGSGASNLNIMNNIFVNSLNNTTTSGSKNYCVYSAATNTAFTTINYNDYYPVSSANSTGFVGYLGSDRSSLGDWQTATGKDVNSIAANPMFNSNTNLQPQLGSPVLSAGAPAGGITIDFLGLPRSGTTPSIGAYENGLDGTGPTIVYTPLGNTNSTSQRTLTVTITDASGVPTSGVGLPVLYWKINSGTWNSATGTFISGNNYSFTFGSGVVANDVISYYIAAQDNFTTPNVSCSPSTGASGFSYNPPAVSTPPTTPNSYIITGTPLAGTYTVGTTMFNNLTGKNITFEKVVNKVIKEMPVNLLNNQKDSKTNLEDREILAARDINRMSSDVFNDNLITYQMVEVEEEQWIPMENGLPYTGELFIEKSKHPEIQFPDGVNGVYPTITAAVNDLNLRGVSGPTTFVLVDIAYQSGETFPIVFDSNNEYQPTATNTVTIKPNAGINVLISSTSATSIFKFNGADYITIDGSNDGSNSVNLTISNTNSSTTNTCAIWIASKSVSDGATNNTIKNCAINGYSSTTTIAGFVFGSGTTFGNSAEAPNSNNVIQNNYITSFQNGIYHNGCASPLDQNISITGNTIGSSSSSSILGFRGLILQNAQNFSITGNTILGINTSTSSTSTATGIQIGGIISGGTIKGNTIKDIKQPNTTGWGSNGIFLAASNTNCNLNIFNNVIFDVASYGYAGSSSSDNGYGIMINSGGGYNIYYNSVNLNTNQTATTGLPAAININSGVTMAGSLDIRNNVFSNSQTVGTQRYAIYSGAANTVYSNINYNNYYYTGANLGYLGAANVLDLTAWRTATGQDQFSVSGNPGFTSPTDLQPDAANNNCWNLNGMGTPLASVSTDILGTARSTTVATGSTDLGAYEFTPTSTPPAPTLTGTIGVGNTQTFTLSGNTLGSILWTGGTALPTSLVFQYNPGQNPKNPSGNYSNAHWNICQTGGTDFTYDLTLNYTPSILGTIANESDIRLASIPHTCVVVVDDPVPMWTHYETSVVNTTNKTVTMTGLTSFSQFALSDNNNPMPVELTTFEAKVTDRIVNLSWKTATENNSSKFIIERKNNNNWTVVGETKASGISNSIKEYRFVDKKLNSGKYQYRLKMVDVDGSYSYSNVIEAEVELPKTYALSQNYPNPFNPTTRIDYQLPLDAKVTIELYTISGEKVATLVNNEQTAGYYTLDINASREGLSSGVYIYRMIAQDKVNAAFTQVKKMMMIK